LCRAEDGIRALIVTGVQTCPLPILPMSIDLGGLMAVLESYPARSCPFRNVRDKTRAPPSGLRGRWTSAVLQDQSDDSAIQARSHLQLGRLPSPRSDRSGRVAAPHRTWLL